MKTVKTAAKKTANKSSVKHPHKAAKQKDPSTRTAKARKQLARAKNVHGPVVPASARPDRRTSKGRAQAARLLREAALTAVSPAVKWEPAAPIVALPPSGTRPTGEQIAEQIRRLKAVRPRVRHFSMFGDDNLAALDTMVDVLERRISENGRHYEDLPDQSRSQADSAFHWLRGEEDQAGDPSNDLAAGWPLNSE